MPDRNFYLHSILAHEALEKILALIHETYPKETITKFRIDTTIKANHFVVSNTSSTDLINHEICVNALNFFKEFSFVKIELAIATTQKHAGFKFSIPKDKAGYQIELVENTQEDQDANYITTFLKTIKRHFPISDKIEITNQQIDNFQKEQIEIYQRNITQLQEISGQLIKNASDQFSKWDESIAKLTTDLQEKFQNKELYLNEKIERKESALKDKMAEFEAMKKDFDDRERTVVRRDLLTKIEKVIKDQEIFTLSNETVEKRKKIDRICFWVLIINLFFISIFVSLFFKTYLINQELDWHVLAPTSPFVLGFVSMVIYFLRWNGQWFREHADAEFLNKKFSSDILRASWIAEMFFEWKEQKEFDFPNELIQSFTKNLFEDPSSRKCVQHPLEDFMKSAGKVTKLRLGKGVFEAEKAKNDDT